MNNLDLNYLKYFYYVTREGGFTKAAEILHVQQPVISRAVKLLEQQLGFKLLERQKKQIILTTEGREIYNLAQKIFHNTDQITAFAKDRKEQTAGDLCFATSDSLSPETLGPLLVQIKKQYPQIRPIHHAGPATFLLDQIREGKIEFGLFFNVPDLTPDLDKTKLAQIPFVFVIAKTQAKNKTILESFIASREQGSFDSFRLPLFEKYKQQHKNTQITAVSSSSIARKDMALNGLGVTVLPHFLIQTELKNGVLKSLSDDEHFLPLYLVERKSSYRSKLKNSVLSEIKKIVEK
ncbi:hypothetical protein CIK05_08680 [Bdellovibrio sp. qaytius]|nr:hypothetical protein CIK05_08680 [Bdellovibrio sp. qaytius]